MSREQSRQVEILREQQAYNGGFLTVTEAEVRYTVADGSLSTPVRRLNVGRGHSVGVLLYDRQADAVVLVRQFRYPAYSAPLPDDEPRGWLLEIVAGKQEPDQSTEETARREAEEEVGYRLDGPLVHVATCYATPGASSEQIAIFLAEIDLGSRSGAGGGVDEGEDTELVVLPRTAALDMLRRGVIHDAKTVIALQALALGVLPTAPSSPAS